MHHEEEDLTHPETAPNNSVDSVVVLTPTILTLDQTEVLQKGLNFSLNAEFEVFHTLFAVIRFFRLLTVQRNFFQEKEESNDSLVQHGINHDPICNEFDGMLYKEQLSLITLQELNNVNMDYNDYDKSDFGPGYINPSFYPLKSRVPALNVFQSS